MADSYDLERFVQAQKRDFKTALSEIKKGRKVSHWMWYIFPQIQGLGYSDMAQRYAIQNMEEAAAYLHHPTLRSNLIDISHKLLQSEHNNATRVFGTPDDMKLKSSMTLFSLVPHTDPVFEKVLHKFFGGNKDAKTLQILGRS